MHVDRRTIIKKKKFNTLTVSAFDKCVTEKANTCGLFGAINKYVCYKYLTFQVCNVHVGLVALVLTETA